VTVAALVCVLPVSGQHITLRHLTGRDEMLLLETGGSEPERGLAFLERLACGGADPARLPVADVDALFLLLRRAMIGERIVAEALCSAPGCGAPVDLAFEISGFLSHHRPQAPRLRGWDLTPDAAAEGWFELRRAGPTGAAVRFRLPTASDERDAAHQVDGAAALAQSCFAPFPPPRAAAIAAETAMAALAPPLAGTLAGSCPDCGAELSAPFDPRRYILAEFTARAAFVSEEVDVLAARYHWSEEAILDLPSRRRAAYVAMAERAA
jgi:hypothetical protein